MCSAADRSRLESLLRRAKRLGYCAGDVPTVAVLFDSTDDDFFHRIKTNSNHFCNLTSLTRLTYLTGFAPALTI